jgi:hypothetical protein
MEGHVTSRENGSTRHFAFYLDLLADGAERAGLDLIPKKRGPKSKGI